MIFSGFFAILAAMGHQGPPAIAGALAIGMGACELHGASELRHGRAGGIRWMVGGELGLLLVVVGYAGWMATHFDPVVFQQQLPEWYMQRMEHDLRNAGLSENEFPTFWRFVNRVAYSVVAFVTVIYQGGLAFYYHRRTATAKLVLGE
ncbi:hypothetical protein [Synoicihabitans lomoniglobus]|nr:hypothetical protein [Opitutaceae bacterium LMO-M01]